MIQLYPLNCNNLGGKYTSKEEILLPFPTMMWICCRKLHAEISKLEDYGWINIFQTKLLDGSEQSNQWLESMRDAHLSYSRERWNLLLDNDKDYVVQKDW